MEQLLGHVAFCGMQLEEIDPARDGSGLDAHWGTALGIHLCGIDDAALHVDQVHHETAIGRDSRGEQDVVFKGIRARLVRISED